MSFREKHLCISLIAGLGVWGFYFWRMIAWVRTGGLTDDRFAGDMSGLFMGCLVLVVLIEVVLTVLATLTTPKAERDTRDEREMLASLKASHVALMGLLALIFTLATAVYFMGLIGGNLLVGWRTLVTDVNAMVVLANILMACAILAEMARAAVTLVLLRRLR